MKFSVSAKTMFASVVYSSGVLDVKLRRRADEVAILMYHRILTREEARRRNVQTGMYVAPDTLETHLRYLAGRFKIVPIREIPDVLSGRGRNVSRPRCALTFDDGWRDFRDHAFPLLRNHGIPATVFLPTDFIGSQDRFWTDRIVALFDSMETSGGHGDPGNGLAGGLIGLKGDRESRIEKAIDILKGIRAEEIETCLSEIARSFGSRPDLPSGTDFLPWEEVREMSASGLVSFGSHTAAHRILTTLSREEVRDELGRSRRKLLAEEAVDPSFIPFCYPNGNHNEEIADMVRETGYHLAVTTEGGWNGAGADLFSLRRIGVHEDMTRTVPLFGCRIAGLL